MSVSSSRAEPPSSFFGRYGRWVVLVILALLPLASLKAIDALRNLHNATGDWLPPTFKETRELFWFIDHFQTDEILVVSWPGCTIHDKRLDILANEISHEGQVDRQGEFHPWFQRVITGRTVLEELKEKPLESLATEAQREQEALRRMRGWLVGPDGQTTCAILVVSGQTVWDHARQQAVEAVVRIATQRLDISPEDLHLGGPTMDTVAVDSESVRSLYLLSAISVGVGLFLSWWFLGSWRLVAMVIVTAGMCELWSVALVSICHSTMDMVLIMMPALVYILAVSGCIHQLNYYQEEVRQGGVVGAAGRSLAHCWQPSILAASTTAIGLLSLAVGDVVPIRKFGAFAALGVMVSLVFLFLFLPSLLEIWPARRPLGENPEGPARVSRPSPSQRLSLSMASFGTRYYRSILIGGLLLVPIMGWGLSQIQTSVKLQHLYSERARILQDYHWIEDHIGALVPVEIVVRFPHGYPMPVINRLKVVEQIRQKIESLPEIGSTVTVADFVPPIPAGGSALQTGTRGAIQHFLREERKALQGTHYLAEKLNEQGNSVEELWRISARVGAFSDVDYSEFLEKLRSEINPVLEQYQMNGEPPLRVLLSGGVPLVSLVQRRMLNDLGTSFGTAFLSIAVVIAIVMRSLGASLVMMIPNVMPPLLVFGMMGMTRTVVDLGSMMTISTALGISVDNELHFFTWFRRALEQGVPYSEAVMLAYRRCGSAVAETAIICGLGLVAFSLSPFVPVSRFGWLMFLLLMTAMVGDLIIMPALMASPLGWFFGRRRKNAVEGQQPRLKGDEVSLDVTISTGANER